MSRLTIALLCAGLMGSAMAADGGGQVAVPATAAKPASPDKVIADIQAASGMNVGFEKMVKGFTDGFNKGLQEAQARKGTLPADLQQAMEASVRESFTAKGFLQRVSRAMKRDYNEQLYNELLADLSTPLSRRMVELEAQDEPPEQEIAAYLQKLASNPLPAARIDMIHRLDEASRASDLVSTVVLSINKGVLRGLSGANGKCLSEGQIKRAEEAMVQQMEETKDSFSGAMQTALTYTYRDVSDADLAEYVKLYEKEGNRHIHDVIYAALVEEYNEASARMGRSMMKALRARLATSGNQACEALNEADGPNATLANAAGDEGQTAPGMAPASEPSAASGVEAPKSSLPLEKRKGGDITQCLEAGSKSDKDIAACAEQYRPRR